MELEFAAWRELGSTRPLSRDLVASHAASCMIAASRRRRRSAEAGVPASRCLISRTSVQSEPSAEVLAHARFRRRARSGWSARCGLRPVSRSGWSSGSLVSLAMAWSRCGRGPVDRSSSSRSATGSTPGTRTPARTSGPKPQIRSPTAANTSARVPSRSDRMAVPTATVSETYARNDVGILVESTG